MCVRHKWSFACDMKNMDNTDYLDLNIILGLPECEESKFPFNFNFIDQTNGQIKKIDHRLVDD